MAGREPPARWPVRLPDLRSRLSAVTAVAIAPPDDTLLAAILVKLFSDRQLRVDREVIDYLLARMERSFGAAERLVGRLDALGLALGRRITVALARRAIEEEEKEG
jgi:chromosomal replication initiation ATPase DnaA